MFLECPKPLAAIGENNVPVYLHSVRIGKDMTGGRHRKYKDEETAV